MFARLVVSGPASTLRIEAIAVDWQCQESGVVLVVHLHETLGRGGWGLDHLGRPAGSGHERSDAARNRRAGLEAARGGLGGGGGAGGGGCAPGAVGGRAPGGRVGAAGRGGARGRATGGPCWRRRGRSSTSAG